MMKITVMDNTNINTSLGLKIQAELRLLSERVILGEMTRLEIKIICKSLVLQQNTELFDGFWPIIASKNMPCDAAVDFLHVPTQYATMILMRGFLMNIDREVEGFEECFKKGLLASIKSKLRGHGYESQEHQLDMVSLFIKAGLLEFIDLYGDFCSEFTVGIKKILDDICCAYDEKRTMGMWGSDYTEKYRFIANSVRNYNLKVFVYGTLMMGECNHHYLDGCPVYGDAKIYGYYIYDTGYGYPAIVYSEDTAPVEGELYGINSSVLKHLDYLEDNEDMYTREFVVATDSLGHTHLALVYKYNYEVDPDRKIDSWVKKSSNTGKVWYVSYGSNLCYKRFMDYINRCSDNTEPKYDKPVLIEHELYFAKESVLWDYKGTAFIDDKYDKTCKTIGRMYLITEEQYEEVKRFEGSKYQNKLELGTYSGIPMVSFTSFDKTDINGPSEAYKAMIARGIAETFSSLSESEIIEYIDKHI